MPEKPVNPPQAPEVQLMQEQIMRLLDELFGPTTRSEPDAPRVTLSAMVRPETLRRLEAIAKMHPGYEVTRSALVGRLLDGFAQGLIPCPFCYHPYPPRLKRQKEKSHA